MPLFYYIVNKNMVVGKEGVKLNTSIINHLTFVILATKDLAIR